MLEIIGSILPSALGVAVSPVPVIAVVLMLMTPRAHATGAGFLGGWLTGIAVAVVVAWLLVASLPGSTDGEAAWAGWARIVVGLLLIWLAVRYFRSPSGADDLPGWMAAVDTMSVGRAFALGAALAALNPKNVAMVLAAADAVRIGANSGSQELVALVAFVLLAGSSVALPVVAHLAGPDRVAAPLGRLREWLTVHNSSVMGTLLLVLGVVLVSQGTGAV